jgi:hypothetical protein
MPQLFGRDSVRWHQLPEPGRGVFERKGTVEDQVVLSGAGVEAEAAQALESEADYIEKAP